jgi:hypothetical protein
MATHAETIINIIRQDMTKSDEEKAQLIGFLNSSDKFKKSTVHLKSKFDALLSFIKFIETNVPQSYCKIYGSFVRQMFEKMFLSTYDESGYGDSQNHDVDINIFESKESYLEGKTEFNNIIDTFEVMSKLDFDANIKFGDFHLVRIHELTINISDYDSKRIETLRKRISDYIIRYNTHALTPISENDIRLPSRNIMQDRIRLRNLEQSIKDKFDGIPHFNIVLKNPSNGDYIIIDLIAYPIVDEAKEYNISDDINVNTLYMTRDGIKSRSDFLESIKSISDRTGIVKINMEKMKEDLKIKTLTFNEKSKIYNRIVNFMGFRTKILSVGYEQIQSDDKMVDIIIEKTESCPITNAKAPYTSINMDCGHSLSVMAFSGLVNIRSSDYTEQILCPTCRAQLLPKMVNKKPNSIEIPEPSIVSHIFQTGQSRRGSISIQIPRPVHNEIISTDNLNTVFENLGLKPYIDNNVENQEEN